MSDEPAGDAPRRRQARHKQTPAAGRWHHVGGDRPELPPRTIRAPAPRSPPPTPRRSAGQPRSASAESPLRVSPRRRRHLMTFEMGTAWFVGPSRAGRKVGVSVPGGGIQTPSFCAAGSWIDGRQPAATLNDEIYRQPLGARTPGFAPGSLASPVTTRRRNRTFQAGGCPALPVLKTGRNSPQCPMATGFRKRGERQRERRVIRPSRWPPAGPPGRGSAAGAHARCLPAAHACISQG
jgi:hypothetical protein